MFWKFSKWENILWYLILKVSVALISHDTKGLNIRDAVLSYRASIKYNTTQLTFEQIKINYWPSGHIYLIKRDDFRCIRKFHHLPENQNWWVGGGRGRNSKTISTNPNQVIAHFQGIDIIIRIKHKLEFCK